MSGMVIGIDLWEPEKVKDIVHQHKFSQPSRNTIQNARRNATLEGVDHKIEFINMDANRLQFADNTFDVAVCGFIVGHQGRYIPNTLKEIQRVIKPGGKLVLIDNFRDWTYFLLSTPHLFILSLMRGTKAKQLTDENWKNWVEKAGFQIEKVNKRKGIITIEAVAG